MNSTPGTTYRAASARHQRAGRAVTPGSSGAGAFW